MIRPIVVLGVLTLCAFAAPAADPPEFKEYASKEGRYKVLMPGKVETSEKKRSGLDTFSAASTLPSGMYFNVSYFDLKETLPADKAQEVLKAICENSKDKTLSSKGRTLGKDKIPAHESVQETKGLFLRQLAVMHGPRLYQVILTGPTKADVTSKDADKYFESFEIVK